MSSPDMLSPNGVRTPTSYLMFNKRVSRRDHLVISPNKSEAQFVNYRPFTPQGKNQVEFGHQVKRPPFIKPNYVSMGGLSYNIEPAVEKFRMNERL